MKPSYIDLIVEGDCAEVGGILGRVGDKWTILVVVALADGALRFSELKRTIGHISPKMLAATLRTLERDGFVTRTLTATVPPRVDYALTDLGLSLTQIVGGLAKWVVLHRLDIRLARSAFDEARPPAPRLISI